MKSLFVDILVPHLVLQDAYFRFQNFFCKKVGIPPKFQLEKVTIEIKVMILNFHKISLKIYINIFSSLVGHEGPLIVWYLINKIEYMSLKPSKTLKSQYSRLSWDMFCVLLSQVSYFTHNQEYHTSSILNTKVLY